MEMKSIEAIAALAVILFAASVGVAECHAPSPSYFSPCIVVVSGEGFTNRLSNTESRWSDGEVSVSIDGNGQVHVISPKKGLSSVSLSWKCEWPDGALFLNDAWERSYGELEYYGVRYAKASLAELS